MHWRVNWEKKGGLKVQNLGLAAIPWGLWNRLMRIGEFFGGLRFKKNWKPSNRFYFALLPRGNKVGAEGVRVSPNAKGGWESI